MAGMCLASVGLELVLSVMMSDVVITVSMFSQTLRRACGTHF